MKTKFKTPSIVFCVLSVVFTVIWIAAFIVFPLFGCKEAGYGMQYIVKGWLLPQWDNIVSIYLTHNIADWHFWVNGVIDLFFIVCLIVGIIVACKRQRARLVWYTVMWVIVSFIAVVAVCNFYFDNIVNVINGVEFFIHKDIYKIITPDVLSKILYICIPACAAVAFIFTVLTYVFGLLYAKARLQIPAPVVNEDAEPEVPAVEEQPVAAEEVKEAEDVGEAFATVPAEAPVEEVVAPAFEELPAEPVANEPMADFAVEPEEMQAQPEEIVVEEIPVEKEVDPKDKPVNKDDLATILRDVVRDIVRDEIARSEAKKEDEKPHCDHPDHPFGSITGATFGGPLVVQYFNGGINSPVEPAAAPAPVVAPAPVAPAPAPAPVEEKKPVIVEKKEEKVEPVVVPTPAPVVVSPVVVTAPAPEAPKEEKVPFERISFTERLLQSEKEVQDNYNELKNEFLSWGLHSRVSSTGDCFRLHTKTYAKIVVAGKGLKIYYALNPKDYTDSTFPFTDSSNKSLYVDIPFTFKVKSGLSLRRAKQLIQEACDKDGLTQSEVESINWVKELRAEQKAAKK